RSARDPYFLYAASNAGSMLGLLAYPIIVERRLTLDEQRATWVIGFVAFVGLVALCAVATRLRAPLPLSPFYLEREGGGAGYESAKLTPHPNPPPQGGREQDLKPPTQGGREQNSAPSSLRILKWVALAALPSSLLMGVTTHLTTDIAPVPLLWVVPLA